MNVEKLVIELRLQAIELEIVEDKLRATCPTGPPPEALRQAIRENREPLLAFLRGGPVPAGGTTQVAEVQALLALADSIGARMRRLSAISRVEWEAFRDQLLADDDQLAAGMKRRGLRLEDLGWRLGPGSRWERPEAHGGEE